MLKFQKLFIFLLALISLTLGTALFAQDETVTVPDVTGLNVPQAAAALNRAGLRLGVESSIPWTEDSGLTANTITEQSIAVGENVSFGTSVDITVLRGHNATLVYDDNDITLVNQSGGTIELGAIAFNSVGGSSTASFSAARWSGALSAGDCGQLWSVGRTSSKDVEGCTGNTFWLTTNDSNQHFWTGANGTTQFNVVQNGVERAVCTISNPGTCSLFLESSGALETTGYLYIAYSEQNSWIIFNNSEDRWMSLRGVLFSNTNTNPGDGLTQEAVSTSDNPDQVVGDITLLAPNQCLFVKSDQSALESPSIPCDVIASFTVALTSADRTQPLYVTAATDGEQRMCPPYTPERLTVCILPS